MAAAVNGAPAGSPSPAACDAFFATCTRVSQPPLLPELRLHLATEITPLWEAVERFVGREGTDPPFWAFCWAGGQALARWVLDHPDVVVGRRVLDVGCGGGVAAIAAARAGAAAVTANDIDPLALAMVARNAASNGVQIETVGVDLLSSPVSRDWDVVLVGDLCYEAATSVRLADWLRHYAAGGAVVLMGDPGRKYQPSTGLEALAHYDVPTTRELEDRAVRETVVWRVLP